MVYQSRCAQKSVFVVIGPKGSAFLGGRTALKSIFSKKMRVFFVVCAEIRNFVNKF